jgi:predicted dehydrogenase
MSVGRSTQGERSLGVATIGYAFMGAAHSRARRTPHHYFEQTSVHEIADFVRDVVTAKPPTPSSAEGLQVQRLLDAVERPSADNAA